MTDTAVSPTAAPAARPRRRRLLLALGIFGPGLIVMLADGDAGCLITAAQSGAQWGYRLILPQLVLIPILYLVQEMTVRLGVATDVGHAALIRKQFGKPWALASAGAMLASAVGTLVVEFVAVAGVGELFGLSEWLTVPVAMALLVALRSAAAASAASRPSFWQAACRPDVPSAATASGTLARAAVLQETDVNGDRLVARADRELRADARDAGPGHGDRRALAGFEGARLLRYSDAAEQPGRHRDGPGHRAAVRGQGE